MADQAGDTTAGDAEGVYAAPAAALAAARSTLSRPGSTPAERAEALWVLGRSAYYANQMSDAVRLLREAVPLVEEPGVLTEVLLTLAPALSKQGHPEQALELLEGLGADLEERYAGQLRNQRGIILTELGRLPEALHEMEGALALLRAAGDAHREARTLVNLGAVASMMGLLDDAERWLALAREATVATGQEVVAAGIEGNLGYVESRRGNFATALAWYGRARTSFEGLGDVALLVAVLEADHARTLLDVGLLSAAVEAAERAAGSAAAGGNQMLETTAQLLLAESLLRLGEHRGADRAVRRGADLARRLGQAPWQLRAAQLAGELDDAGDGDVRREIDQLLEAGWVQEAFGSALRRAIRLRRTDRDAARDLLALVETRTCGRAVDAVDRALAGLLVAEMAEDAPAADAAFQQALDAVVEQRDLLGSVEMRACLAHRLRPVLEVALSHALRGDAPAEAVLDVLERTRAVRDASTARPPAAREDAADLTRLRVARSELEETKLAGGDVDAAATSVRRLEGEVLGRRRSESGGVPRAVRAADVGEVHVPHDTVFLTWAVHEDRVVGVVRTPRRTGLVDLAPLAPLRSVVRTQRAALRHLADERRPDPERDLDRLAVASRRLGDLLVGPLGIDDAERVVLTPPAELRDVSWAAIPGLDARPVTVASTLRAWCDDHARLDLRRLAVLGGPGLRAGSDELAAIGEVWRRPGAVVPLASSGAVMEALRSADLVHVSAHGSFRSDNPFFSSLELADGPLSILEMSEVAALPSLVVLASCDAAAAGAQSGADEVVVGTATELRNQGAHVVVAPSVAVNDAAAGALSLHLHQALARGAAVDDAVLGARSSLLASSDPRHRAAAGAFQVFGGRSTREAPVVELVDGAGGARGPGRP